MDVIKEVRRDSCSKIYIIEVYLLQHLALTRACGHEMQRIFVRTALADMTFLTHLRACKCVHSHAQLLYMPCRACSLVPGHEIHVTSNVWRAGRGCSQTCT